MARIQGFANSSGEYHKKPTIIVATAATTTYTNFTPRICMSPLFVWQVVWQVALQDFGLLISEQDAR
jgi:hypothetical protein